MTIGKNSKKSSIRSSIRVPKFLDKSNGFYGRLDELESTGKRRGEEMVSGVVTNPAPQNVIEVFGADEREEVEVCDCNEGIMEDDGETLLRREPGCRSSRWGRRSRSKQKTERAMEAPVSSDEDTRPTLQVELEKLKKKQDEMEKFGRGNEPELVHFPVQEDDDDQVLIRDKKRGREKEAVAGKEERRMKKEQEEGMKMVKRSMVKNYRKALDQALRRGWEAFIANLYSVTLTPVASSTSSPSPSLQKKLQLLAEFH